MLMAAISSRLDVPAWGGELSVILEGRNRRAGKEVPSGVSVRVGDAHLTASRQSVRRPPTSLLVSPSHIPGNRGTQVTKLILVGF